MLRRSSDVEDGGYNDANMDTSQSVVIFTAGRTGSAGEPEDFYCGQHTGKKRGYIVPHGTSLLMTIVTLGEAKSPATYTLFLRAAP